MITPTTIRYYGWSAISVETPEGTLHFDPFFRHYCGAQWFKLKDFSDAKYICVTHGHEEHFLDVPDVTTTYGATVIGPPSVTRFLGKRHKVSDEHLVTMKAGETREVPGFKITTFNWQHRDINLVKAITKAVFQGNTTQLAWVWSSVTNAPFYAPYTGYHLELANGLTVLNYNEGFNSKMSDAEIEELGRRFRTDVLLAGMQLDFVSDVARGAKALNPKVVVLFPPHDKFHEMMGAKSRPWVEFAAAVQAAVPNAKVIIAEPGTAINGNTGDVLDPMPLSVAA